MWAPLDEIEEELGPVEMAAPPTPGQLMTSIDGMIGDAAAKLGPDDVAMLLAVATSDKNGKAVFVMNTESGWKPVLWFERKDGNNVAGVGVLKTWKRR